jgi:dTDP-4-amino-4,6-dideoxygalactose transaminase
MTYKVRFVNPQKQYQNHKKEYLFKINEVLSRGDLIDRADLAEFEKKLAKFVGVKYAVGVNSGTGALSMSMKAAGIGPGDEVIVPAHTYISSISAVCHQGAKPVLVDCGPDFNISSDLIEKAITKKTKAIEPVHLNGHLCEMDKITAIAKKYKLLIIEDAAQALGAKFKTKSGKWQKAGSFGLAGCFSFYPFKSLGAFGDAGIVVTNNRELAQKVRRLRYNGQDRKNKKFYFHGNTEILDNLQAAILAIKLKYFPDWLKRRRQIASLYQKELETVRQIKLPHFGKERFFDSYQNYVIRAPRRNELKKYLNKEGIETMVSWPKPMYKQPIMMPNKINLPETERICGEVLSLPMYPELEDWQIKYVSGKIKDFYRKTKSFYKNDF